jgi:hypothetical protein
MKIFTTHLKPGASPLLVREGFSWAAAVFGWLWLLLQGAWIPAVILFAATLLLLGHPGPWSGALLIGLCVAQGCFGRDLVRWSISLRGFTQGPIIAARDLDSAYARLITERPDLFPSLAPTTLKAGALP